MEVQVVIDAEDLISGEKRCCMTAYFVFVALDASMQPVAIPPLKFENDFERSMAEEAAERMKARKATPKVCWTSYY